MPNYSKQLPLVASFTDAWIETVIGLISGLWVGVASFTDAWIETHFKDILKAQSLSHLLQMRGLKRHYKGEWAGQELSHLLQMRGLKLFAHPLSGMSKKSHLLQMRGLKPSPGGIAKKLLVASFTDAWIETRIRH